MSELELWGGHECTVNRVGDTFADQTILSGHHDRLSDLELFASLGVKAIRYPVLWERVAPNAPGEGDWRWTDERLTRLHHLKLRVIAGLVHHGSGPRYVDLLSPDFAPGLARHAAEAARRYRWIVDWTPVNEPLTTARFSALYGHWHPHARDERTFWIALLNQVDAIRLSMKEVRKVIPNARLVQTEDLGRTLSTPELEDQARFDNERRWMTWDLLLGRVTRGHFFWERLERLGLADRLRAIADDPCPPDIVGINHYLTSDRFLDHRLDRYPGVPVGGNGRMSYVDVESVRVVSPCPNGPHNALMEAWRRYETTLAVTEAHNGSTRDEQVRWFAEVWSSARSARAEGADVAAVTAWSLLGSYNWSNLLTKNVGHYECGVFDVSSGEPRETALASYLRQLARDPVAAPDCGGAGWWSRDDVRLAFAPAAVKPDETMMPTRLRPHAAPLLVVGSTGTLGKAIARACLHRDLEHVSASRGQIPLGDRGALERALIEFRPRAVINAAGWVRVDEAEDEEEACRRANTEGAVLLAEVCAEAGVPSVTFSSDLVFDGAVDRAYVETDATNPLNVYGSSKADAERAILALSCESLIIRTSAFFSPHDPFNFAAWIIRELSEGRGADCAHDVVISPTFVPALAHAVLDLVLDREHGVWHVSNDGALSWADFARHIAAAASLDETAIRARSAEELHWIAPRPRYSALSSSRGRLLGDVDEAIWRFARHVRDDPRGIAFAQDAEQACTAAQALA